MRYNFIATAHGYWTRMRSVIAESEDEARQKLIAGTDPSIDLQDNLGGGECASETALELASVETEDSEEGDLDNRMDDKAHLIARVAYAALNPESPAFEYLLKEGFDSETLEDLRGLIAEALA